MKGSNFQGWLEETLPKHAIIRGDLLGGAIFGATAHEGRIVLAWGRFSSAFDSSTHKLTYFTYGQGDSLEKAVLEMIEDKRLILGWKAPYQALLNDGSGYNCVSVEGLLRIAQLAACILVAGPEWEGVKLGFTEWQMLGTRLMGFEKQQTHELTSSLRSLKKFS